ncbi:unnamed protein product [Hymenolepis diminuta]|uniref:Uncharacterized protein n=1 Tax=Hymenolepis diminuta TaxID=6216 RepID=A0A564XZT1_HYMDI|nr:unnamed protein product [Hymenolepis diminuta]
MVADPRALTNLNITNRASMSVCDNRSYSLATQSITTTISWFVNNKTVLLTVPPPFVKILAFRITTSETANFEYATGCNTPICSKRTSSSSTIFISTMVIGFLGRNTQFALGFRNNMAIFCEDLPKVSSNTIANRFIKESYFR